MSTRSRVGIIDKDKHIKSIYIHFDGYIQGGVGETLFKYYQDVDTIKALIELGDCSILHNTPQETAGSAYGKAPAIENCSLEDLYDNWVESGEDYLYVYSIPEKQWYVHYLGDEGFRLLEDLINEK